MDSINGLSYYLNSPHVRSWSEDHQVRPEGGSRTSGALATRTARNLSTADDHPPEADPIAR